MPVPPPVITANFPAKSFIEIVTSVFLSWGPHDDGARANGTVTARDCR
jgi:hypothetical protein